MQRRKWIIASALVVLSSIAAALLLVVPQASQAAVPAGLANAPQSKISGELRSEFAKLAPNAKMRYIAVLSEQANTANDIRDWNAKGRYVLDTLKGVAAKTQAPVRALLDVQKRAGNVDKYKGYYIINAFAVWGNLSSVEALAARPEISSIDVFPVITLDETEVQAPANSPDTVEWNVNHIRAPQAWAMGYTGAGVSVGSLDTGARYTHEAIVRQYRGNLGGGNFDHNYNWWPAVGTSMVPVDDSASSYHGSHTIGTMVGEDASQTNQIGVAPGAKWIATNGIHSQTSDPDVIEAGQWILAPWDLSGQNPDPTRRPRVVGNSWGYGGSSFSCSSATFFRTIVLSWVAAGIFPSFSAGNAGTAGSRPPAAYPETFETGSITIGWAISSFSSRGPSCFDGGQHPQVVTGGSSVRSVNGGTDNGYSILSGTSMAQPATAGSVAVLLQANPNLTIPQIWYILTSTAVMTPSWGSPPSNTYGWGVIQLDAAVQAALGGGPTSTPTSVPNTPTRTVTPTVCPPLAPGVVVGQPAEPVIINGPASGDNRFAAASNTSNSSVAAAPASTDDPIAFQNDDGSSENSIGFGTATSESAAIWINRFTPPAGAFPITLEAIQIYWPPQSGGQTLIGKTARLLVYGDADGDNDPSNATLLSQQLVTITTQSTFQTFNVNVVAPGPTGDIYVGFEDYWAEQGYMPPLYPAAIDTTPPSRVRSWVAAMGSGDPPDINNLGNNDVLGTIDSFNYPGNWLIRASGQTGGGGCPATSTPTRTATSVATGTPTRTSTVAPTSTPCTINFSDVHPSDYFYEGVRYLACRGVISGYSDGTFRPYNDTTRGQMTKIVVLAFGYPIYTPLLPTFIDVPPTDPFYQYVETAAHENIVSGYSDGTFRPYNNVTRGQLSKIDVIAAGWPLINPSQATFSDVPLEHTFFTYIETAYCHGIISGYSDGTFRPGNNATRGQIAKIVYESVINTVSCD